MDANVLEFRPATRSDARQLAELYRLSSDGVADYIWTRLAEPGEAPLDVGARRYARENTDFSYQNATVAVAAAGIVGMMAGYAVGPSGQSSTEFDFDVDPVLGPYSKLEQPDSFYISGMAVIDSQRGRGVGRQFLQLAADKARTAGLEQVSLLVFEQNAAAKRLYERVGFREVAREPVVPHALIHHGGDVLLMVKTL